MKIIFSFLLLIQTLFCFSQEKHRESYYCIEYENESGSDSIFYKKLIVNRISNKLNSKIKLLSYKSNIKLERYSQKENTTIRLENLKYIGNLNFHYFSIDSNNTKINQLKLKENLENFINNNLNFHHSTEKMLIKDVNFYFETKSTPLTLNKNNNSNVEIIFKDDFTAIIKSNEINLNAFWQVKMNQLLVLYFQSENSIIKKTELAKNGLHVNRWNIYKTATNQYELIDK